MKIKVKVKYPKNFPYEDNYTIIEADDDLSVVELNEECLNYALDMIFATGITWDYEKID